MYTALQLSPLLLAIISIITLRVTCVYSLRPNVTDCQLECYSSEYRRFSHRIEHIETDCTEISYKTAWVNDMVHLQPTVYEVFETKANDICLDCTDTRWLPGLNITWSVTEEDTSFELQWRQMPLYNDPTTSRKCMKILIPYEMKYTKCIYSCPEVIQNNIFIRVIAGSRSKEQTRISESMINFKERSIGNVLVGLPMFYCRKDLNLNIPPELIANPRFWSPIINVWNNTRDRNVTVQFDTAPDGDSGMKSNHRFKSYIIDLIFTNFSGADIISQTIIYKVKKVNCGDEFGRVTFPNVSSGNYFIRIEPQSQSFKKLSKSCWTRLGSNVIELEQDPLHLTRDGCMITRTGVFSITDIDTGTDTNTESNALPLVVALSAFIPLALVLIVLLVILGFYKRKHKKKDEILLIYVRDNEAHFRVITSLRFLLDHLGFPCVTLYDFGVNKTNKKSTPTWLHKQIKTVDHIIYISSENSQQAIGLSEARICEAGDNKESLSYHHQLFESCVHVLSELQPPKSCLLLYYSQGPISAPGYLVNSGQFHLMEEFDNFLLFLRNRTSAGKRLQKKFPQKDVRNCKQYNDLVKALEEIEGRSSSPYNEAFFPPSSAQTLEVQELYPRHWEEQSGIYDVESLESEYEITHRQQRISFIPPMSNEDFSCLMDLPFLNVTPTTATPHYPIEGQEVLEEMAWMRGVEEVEEPEEHISGDSGIGNRFNPKSW